MASQITELLFKASGNLPSYLDNISRSMSGMVKSEQSVKTSLKGLASDLTRAKDPTEALEKVISRLASSLKIGISGFAIIAAFKVFKDTADQLADSLKNSSTAADAFNKNISNTKNVTSIEAVKNMWGEAEKAIQETDKALKNIESNTITKLIGKLTGATDIIKGQRDLVTTLAQSETLNRLQKVLDYKQQFASATEDERQRLELSQKIEADKASISSRLTGERRKEADILIEQIYSAEALKIETDKERQYLKEITKQRDNQNKAVQDLLKKTSNNSIILRTQLSLGKESADIKRDEIDLQERLSEIDEKYKQADVLFRSQLKSDIQAEFNLRKKVKDEEEATNKVKELSQKIDEKRKDLAGAILDTQKAINDRIKEGERSSGSLLDRAEKAAQNTGNIRLANNIRNQREADQRQIDKDFLSKINEQDIKTFVSQEGSGKRRSDMELMGSAKNVNSDVATIASEGIKRQTEIASELKKMTEGLKVTMESLTEIARQRLGVPILRSL
jgi:hypothetical protein